MRVTPRDGLMAVKVALAAIESVRTGKPIDIATFTEVRPSTSRGADNEVVA